MSLSRLSCETIKLTSFRLDEIETDRLDANGRPIFRHRRGLRAALARLAAWRDRQLQHPENQRPSDRASCPLETP